MSINYILINNNTEYQIGDGTLGGGFLEYYYQIQI